MRATCRCSLVGLLVVMAAVPSRAAEWPTYRADGARSGYTAEALPGDLVLRWKHVAMAPRPAWPSSSRVTYDFAPQPIIASGLVLIGSSADDRVVALEAGSGRVVWDFFAGGPIRFAPVAWKDRVFVASDDGHLYALALLDGRLLWKHRGAPDGRLSVGHGRMISMWPSRGGPVVDGDRVYYAAGIWPSGGVCLYALDGATGAVAWANDRTGQLRMPQPHGGAEADSGVVPEGYLVVSGGRLFVPTGRAVPAAFRCSDGELEHYLLQENGSIGGARVIACGDYVINGGCFLDAATGRLSARAGRGVFGVKPDGVFQFTGDRLLGYGWDEIDVADKGGGVARRRILGRRFDVRLGPEPDAVRRASGAVSTLGGLGPLLRTDIVFRDTDPSVAKQTGLERMLSQSRPQLEGMGAEVAPFLAAHYERCNEVIGAGREAICGAGNKVHVVDLGTGTPRWCAEVEGDAVGLAAAGGMLVVSTTRGAIYCFAGASEAAPVGRGDGAGRPAAERPRDLGEPGPGGRPGLVRRATVSWAAVAEEILRKSGISSGLCVDLGCGEGELATELARRSGLQVIGFEADPSAVERARRRIAAAGLYGDRVTILCGDPAATGCPRYCANLIVSSRQIEDPSVVASAMEVNRLQRPWGGVSCLGPAGGIESVARGALGGAGSWTHQNADAANTLCSADRLARGPLEIAWYRDGEIEIPDRHAQGPAPLFSRGMLVVMGVHGLCGLDAYNGQTRWVYPIGGILEDWDGVHHDVGIGDTGSNFCLSDEAAFVREGRRCLKIDLQRGKKIAEFLAPAEAGDGDGDWGYIACADGMLYGTILNRSHAVSPRYGSIRLRTESSMFFAMDASTGRVKWRYRPRHSIRNNAIAIAGGRVHLIDRPIAPQDRVASPTPNGKAGEPLRPGEHPGGTLVALDARSGEVLWRNSDDIFGTQLAVGGSRGVLLMYYQAVKHGFFKLPSEVGGRMAAFSAASGERVWDREATYKTRPVINGDTIYAEGGAWEVGSGEPIPWDFKRSYGCGQIAAGAHIMLFRSATLGYLDLTRGAGTENFGGVRPSCWFNAIPAGGMVLVPDGSAKCACSYQHQAWLGLLPPPG